MQKIQNIYSNIKQKGRKMKLITFRYRDSYSNWQWRTQHCLVSDLAECIRIYGLGTDCDYEIISIEEVNR